MINLKSFIISGCIVVIITNVYNMLNNLRETINNKNRDIEKIAKTIEDKTNELYELNGKLDNTIKELNDMMIK